ncbi:MAG: heme ABC exporter ATP-binding protein CcmA [Inquilinaceae bacterium]
MNGTSKAAAMDGGLVAGHGLACRRGGRTVFNRLSFRVEPGGALILTGPNGSGKSSLLRLLAGFLAPAAGTIDWLCGPEADGEPPAIGYVGHRDGVKAGLTALEDVAFWAALSDGREARARALLALEALGIGALAHIPGRYLSAGQRRRVALSRLLAAPSRLWLLDEPTAGLDEPSTARLEDAMARHRGRGGAVILATHVPVRLDHADTLDIGAYAPTVADLEDDG